MIRYILGTLPTLKQLEPWEIGLWLVSIVMSGCHVKKVDLLCLLLNAEPLLKIYAW